MNYKPFGYVFLLAVFATLVMLLMGYRSEVSLPVIILFASLALYCMGHAFFKSFVFTIWVFAFVAASMFYPSAFGTWMNISGSVLATWWRRKPVRK